MRIRILQVLVLLVLLPAGGSWAIDGPKTEALFGQDLHLAGREVISYRLSTGEHLLVFAEAFSMSIGNYRCSGDEAVAWLKAEPVESYGRVRVNYEGQVYLHGHVSVKKGRIAKSAAIDQKVLKKGESMVVRFRVSGGVFVTADKREVADPRALELYAKAFDAVVPAGPQLVPITRVPELPLDKRTEKPVRQTEAVTEPEVEFRYPVNISPAGAAPLKIEQTQEPDGTYVVTLTGRVYLWQRLQKGVLLELQADNAVIWYSEEAWKAYEQLRKEDKAEGVSDFLASGVVPAIYMSGDVVVTKGQRTIQAYEIYYDFERNKALAIDVVMRSFDAERGIPIYVRAAELRQLAEDRFAFEDATLTSSEFHLPQISASASSIILTDTTPVYERGGRVSDRSLDAQMRDFCLKLGDTTIFYWPFVRSNLERPDVPIKSIHAGYDSDWGAMVETRWYLSRLLGVREPEGTESTLAFDYYGKRGFGSGAEIEYAREDYFGRLLGYVIHDSGKDDLGRDSSRRSLEPPRELRGRARLQHRHFLPYNWQLTGEISYLSDENFLEQYYRGEFYVDKGQESLVHLKRIEDNWGLSILGKGRINDFVNELEEFPSVEHHLAGQSLLNDRFTFYSDGQVSRFRQRMASSSPTVLQEFFVFASERAELDMPMRIGRTKVVPFIAGTLGYEDGSGFRTNIDGGTESGENTVWLGEAGARVSTQYWRVYPDVKSQLWDLNQLRHIVRPYLAVAGYTESDSVVEQRDTLSVGISQRLQTRRGPADKQRTVDWMRLNLDFTWVNDSGDTSAGPDRFIWNKPFIPLVDTFSTAVPPQDRRSSDVFGPRRNYLGADYLWRLSDTTAVLGDLNYDMQSGVVQQCDVGFSHLRWPNLSYYIGSRYLRRIEVLDQKGSNAFTFAATYVLDPRYTVVFSQQFDFDYGANVRSDITLIRRYHRVYWGFTYSADESLKKHAIIFSIWPQGVPELAIGPRRYMRLGGSAGY